MAVPADRDQLLRAIDRTFDALYKDLLAVPPDRTGEPVMDGHAKGTRMSVSDLVSYLIGWNELVLKWLARDAAGLPVDFPETGFKWNELGRLAGKFYDDTRGTAYPDLLARLRKARDGIVVEIAARDNPTLYGRPWCGKWTMGRMVQFNSSSPYDNARRRLRRFLASLSRP